MPKASLSGKGTTSKLVLPKRKSIKKKLLMYSIILPTYNERENLPLIVSMIDQTFEAM